MMSDNLIVVEAVVGKLLTVVGIQAVDMMVIDRMTAKELLDQDLDSIPNLMKIYQQQHLM